MATSTTNLNLTKPSYVDVVDVGDLNADMTIIDNQIGTLKSACPFPVGFVYITLANTNPKNTWPGTTWTAIPGLYTLITASNNYAADNFYSPSHQHSTGNAYATLPSHAHSLNGHTHSVAFGSHGHNLNSAGKGVYVINTGSCGRRQVDVISSGDKWVERWSTSNTAESDFEWRDDVVSTNLGDIQTGGPLTNDSSDAKGGGGTHNHGNTYNESVPVYPPLLAVFMWLRTA